jgi:excisionase family DNA binding protein
MNDPKAVDALLEGQPELLTTDEICTLMRVSQGTVLRWMKDQDLPVITVGRGCVASSWPTSVSGCSKRTRSRTDRRRARPVTTSLPGEAIPGPARGQSLRKAQHSNLLLA